jgi:hypothetical protein
MGLVGSEMCIRDSLRAFCIILEHFFQIFLNIFSEIEHEKGAEPVQNTETAPTICY